MRPTPSNQNCDDPCLTQSVKKSKKPPTLLPKKRFLRSIGYDEDGGEPKAATVGMKRPYPSTESRSKRRKTK